MIYTNRDGDSTDYTMIIFAYDYVILMESTLSTSCSVWN